METHKQAHSFQASHALEHHRHHHHHAEVSAATLGGLFVSFLINMFLSVFELVAGLIAGSVSLVGDALHNTSDAFSILIALIAFKIGGKKANLKYTYGFKRAEIIGGFVNLILLFISGVYLLWEGTSRLISPQPIEGGLIIWVSVVALIVDLITVVLSHKNAAHNTNMRMLFVHNLADALGSIGVIVSGLFIVFAQNYRADGVIALLIAAYMIYQSVLAFPGVVNILMNAAPGELDLEAIRQMLCRLSGVKNVHHCHLWQVTEKDVSFECHIETDDLHISQRAAALLKERFGIHHCNIQAEETHCGDECCF